MKRIVVVLSMLFVLSGCGSDGTGPGNNIPTNGSMTARIDGTNWSAVSVSATYSNGVLGVGAADVAGTAIGMGVVANGTGTFQVGASSPTNLLLTMGGASWYAQTTQGSGSITITSLTQNSVAGTFQFTGVATPGTTASGTRTVTNGTFSATF